MHQVEGYTHACPIVQGDPSGHTFKIGCTVCRSAGLKCQWSKFRIHTPAHLQLISLRRHCESPKHILAAKQQGITVILPKEVAMKLDVDRVAPEDGRFLWGLQTSFTNSSYKDYSKFLATETCVKKTMSDTAAQSSHPSDEPKATSKSANHQTCKEVSCAMGAVLDDNDRAIMKRSVRMSWSADDMDQSRVVKLRMVTANPVIQTHSCVAGVVRDPGHSVEDAASGTLAAIKQACTIKIGPLDRNLESCQHREEECVDTQLLEHCHRTIIAGSTDGHEVEILAIKHLKKVLKRMRYFFRDSCHTMNCTHKLIIKWLRHSDTALIDILVSGKGSFAKRVQYSRAFKQIWINTQKGLSIQSLYNICETLCYNETRYHSRTDPMCTLLNHWGSVLECLVEVSKDTSHPDDSAWATRIIEATTGTHGFHRLATFAVEADFFHNCSEAVKQEDDDKHKLSVSQKHLENAIDRASVLFGDGFVFDDEPNYSYTWQLMNGLRDDLTIFFGPSGSHVGKIGWHGIPEEYLEKPLRFANQLFLLMKDFMETFFPYWSFRSKFRCFDNDPDSKLALSIRLDHIGDLAEKEGVSKTQAREQFYAMTKDNEATRLFEQYRDDERVWIILSERQRIAPGSTKFRPDMSAVLAIIFTYLSLEIKTGPIERIFSRLNLIETKHRARHLSLYAVRDALKLAVQLPQSINLYSSPVSDVTKQWYRLRNLTCPGTLITDAKRKYIDLFGAARPTDGTTANLGLVKRAHVAAKDDALADKVRTRLPSTPCINHRVSKAKRRQQWRESADTLMQKAKDRATMVQAGVDPGPRYTVFGTVHTQGATLGRTADQKRMLQALSEHKKVTRAEFDAEEKEHGLSRSVKPFRFRLRNRKSIGVPAHTVSIAQRAGSAAKEAVLKRDADTMAKQRVCEKSDFDDVKASNAVKSVKMTVKRLRIDPTVAASAMDLMPSWVLHGRNGKSGDGKSDGSVSVGAASAACAPVDGRTGGGDAPASHKHKNQRLWSLNGDVLSALENGVLPSAYSMARSTLDADMLVVTGDDWDAKVQYGPASFVCRVLGKALIHLDFVRRPASPRTPIHWLPLQSDGRCQSFKLYVSAACQSKHAAFMRELRWFVDLPKSEAPVNARYKFQLVDTDTDGILNRLKNCNSIRQAHSYRWVCTKDEKRNAVMAIAHTFNVQHASIKLVVSFSEFVKNLGACSSVSHGEH